MSRNGRLASLIALMALITAMAPGCKKKMKEAPKEKGSAPKGPVSMGHPQMHPANMRPSMMAAMRASTMVPDAMSLVDPGDFPYRLTITVSTNRPGVHVKVWCPDDKLIGDSNLQNKLLRQYRCYHRDNQCSAKVRCRSRKDSVEYKKQLSKSRKNWPVRCDF